MTPKNINIGQNVGKDRFSVFCIKEPLSNDRLTEEGRLDRNTRTKANGDAGQLGFAMLEFLDEKQDGSRGHVAKLFQDVIRGSEVAPVQIQCLLKTLQNPWAAGMSCPGSDVLWNHLELVQPAFHPRSQVVLNQGG